MPDPIGGNTSSGALQQALASATLVEELQGLTSERDVYLDAPPPPGASNSISKAPPQLDEPFPFSAEDLADQLRYLGAKNQEAQLLGVEANILRNKDAMERNHAAAIAKMDEYRAKCEEAENASKTQKILGWVTKGLAVAGSAIALIGALAATGLSAGLASPAVIFSAIALTASVISLASAISQECGGPALELSSLLTKGFGAVLTKLGVPEDKAESIGKILAGAAAITLTAGTVLFLDPAFLSNIVAGGMELGGVDERTMAIVTTVVTAATALTYGIAAAAISFGAGGTGQVVNAISKLAALGQAATTVASGGTQIASSSMGIVATTAQHGADTAIADKKIIDAATVALMKVIEENAEEMKKLLKEIEDAMQSISDIIVGTAQSQSVIAANLKGRAAV